MLLLHVEVKKIQLVLSRSRNLLASAIHPSHQNRQLLPSEDSRVPVDPNTFLHLGVLHVQLGIIRLEIQDSMKLVAHVFRIALLNVMVLIQC